MLRLYRISGESMRPNYRHNDLVIAVSRPFCRLISGRVAIVACVEPPLIIKRINTMYDNGDVVLASDNAVTQSRHCGVAIGRERVQALVLCRLPLRMIWLKKLKSSFNIRGQARN
jgi:signal peptidase I